ncbi:lantibiotic dehydratase family protein [Labilibaculum manganireducens]|uniref:lantibiotic dehydratase family protein n=1 Tax=Labilibaculum manganireducens TaxID=1940525 RepID=UPI0029F4C265|nr:lantibiotic dehydratase family protein [Labilibaculum manganireducens]
MQSIALASPSLYNTYLKWSNNELKNKKDEERLYYSMLKYYTRSCMRCTPYGLFAGLCVGDISDESNVILSDKSKHHPHSRLDMDFVCSLIQYLEKIPEIRCQLTYFTNNSLYVLDDKIRFVEFYIQDGKRKHQITGSQYNIYIQNVLNKAKYGATINELINELTSDDISFEQANTYINQLIDNQVLTSSIAPILTGEELFNSLIEKIKNISFNEKLKDILIDISNLIVEIDKMPIGTGVDYYSIISNKMKEIPFEFNGKDFLQTDTIFQTKKNTIDQKLVNEVKMGLSIINKLTVHPSETNLDKFKDSFCKRYGDREISLFLALDTEAGIGFLQNNYGSANDNTPLVDDLSMPVFKRTNISRNIEWDDKQSLLLKKYIANNEEKKSYIEITDEDVKNFEENWKDLPNTLSVITEVVYLEGDFKIVMDSTGGSSAVNLLGRFAYADTSIHKFIEEIIEKEEAQEKNVIYAEIVHLPEGRVGNILIRPNFRKFEIPYLASSSLQYENQIPIEDLLVSVKNDRIVLRSKKLNKEVVPRLSCAHNFSYNSLPIYQFLTNIQISNLKRKGIKFSLGSLLSGFDYFPRVVYKNIILSTATWLVSKEEIKDILELIYDNEVFDEFTKFKTHRNLPDEVILVEGDNKIYVDFKNIMSIKMLLSLIKNKSHFRLKEFLFSSKNGIVKDEKEKVFCNEFVFSFYKEEN